jgi:hypothetical protein
MTANMAVITKPSPVLNGAAPRKTRAEVAPPTSNLVEHVTKK